MICRDYIIKASGNHNSLEIQFSFFSSHKHSKTYFDLDYTRSNQKNEDEVSQIMYKSAYELSSGITRNNSKYRSIKVHPAI